MFVKDMARLFHHADPSMPKSKKVSHLMRGVKEQLYAGLVRNPQTTVDEFTKGATGIKWALQECHQKYNRLATCAPAGGAVFAVTDEQMLCQLIPEIAKENVSRRCSQLPLSLKKCDRSSDKHLHFPSHILRCRVADDEVMGSFICHSGRILTGSE